LNTPFTVDDEIEVETLRRNIHEAVHASVAGFLVPAMASEADKLSDAERDREIATVLDAVKGKVPLIGGASAPTPELRARHARAAIDAGCDGILVNIPYEQDIQYAADVEAIAKLDPGFEHPPNPRGVLEDVTDIRADYLHRTAFPKMETISETMIIGLTHTPRQTRKADPQPRGDSMASRFGRPARLPY
jgi:hypothetical protein